MIQVILNRVLVKPEKLKRSHKIEGTDIELALSHGDKEKQVEASRVEGTVVAIGPTAYKDLTDEVPIKQGDYVVFARYSGVFVVDPETKETLVVLNDSDVLCVVRQGESK
jgi:co-chaperonin GroES (HSP10)